jgi:hypothetical protein
MCNGLRNVFEYSFIGLWTMALICIILILFRTSKELWKDVVHGDGIYPVCHAQALTGNSLKKERL